MATAGTLTTNEDTPADGTLSASDGEGDPLQFAIVANGAKGTAVVTNPATGAYTYTPNANANGSDSFTFKANDGTGDSNTATVTVTITPVNDAPIAVGTSITTAEDTPIDGVLNATDPDGTAISFVRVTSGAKGRFVITNAATGAYTYTPYPNATGSDSFSFSSQRWIARLEHCHGGRDDHAGERRAGGACAVASGSRRRPDTDYAGRVRSGRRRRHLQHRQRSGAWIAERHGAERHLYAGHELQRAGQLHVPGQRWPLGRQCRGDRPDYRTSVVDQYRPLRGLRPVRSGGRSHHSGHRLRQHDVRTVREYQDFGATWTASGGSLPHTGLTALAVDPIASGTLYAAVPRALYKSVDGGVVWSALPISLGPPDSVEVIAIDPITPSTIYVSVTSGISQSSLHKSVDGGTTWSSLPSSGVTGIVAIAIDPLTPTTVYVGGSNAIARTTDGGLHWTSINSDLSLSVRGMAIDPTAPATIFASVASGVIKSTDGGSSWNPTSAPGNGTIVMDPAAPSTLYVGTFGSGVFKTIDGGASWSASNAGIESATIYTMAIDHSTPASIYASPGLLDIGLYRSTNGGDTWTPGGLSGMANAGAASLAIHPATALYVSGNGRILKRLNTDGVWNNLNATGSIPNTFVIDPATPSTFYGFNPLQGFLKSTDSAVTWVPAGGGLPSGVIAPSVGPIAFDPVATGTMYAGTSAGLFSSGSIFKSTDGGESFSPSSNGLPTPGFPDPRISIVSIAVDPVTPSRIYAGVSPVGVFMSIDAGGNWSAVNTGLSDVRVRAVALDRAVPTTLYAATDSGVFKTLDGGAHWAIANSGIAGGPVNSIVVDPGGTDLVYAVHQTTGVYRSRNSGATWSPISAGLMDLLPITLSIDPITHTVYAATRNGVFQLVQAPRATPHVTWAAPADIGYGTALSGNELNATADTAGTFSYVPGPGTILNVGNGQTLSVTFTPIDTDHFTGASASVAINVLPANTTTSLFAFPSSASFLQPVYLIAVVNPVAPGAGIPDGTVTFMEGDTVLGSSTLSNGLAVLASNGLASGVHSIDASYAGSTSFNGGNAAPVEVTIESVAESTFTFVVPVTNPQAAGQQTVLVAAVLPLAGGGEPSGTVQFTDGNTVIGSAAVTGGLAAIGTTTLAAGPHLVGARYLGDGTFTASTGAAGPANHLQRRSSGIDHDDARDVDAVVDRRRAGHADSDGRVGWCRAESSDGVLRRWGVSRSRVVDEHRRHIHCHADAQQPLRRSARADRVVCRRRRFGVEQLAASRSGGAIAAGIDADVR